MTVNVAHVIKTGLKCYRALEPLTGAEWADKHFYLSPESSGIEGKWSCLPYQIGPINWMCDDDIEEFNWMKSARVGYTKCLLIAIGCNIEQKRRNIAAWQPTDGDAHDFATDEIETMLRDVPVVGGLLKCKVGAKSKFNTIEKKSFVGATLDIKGGKSGRNYRRMTKDIAIYDETDGFDPDVDGEGSPFELGDVRIQTSSFPKSIRGSTPRIKGISLIEATFNACQSKFYRFLPCPHEGCGQLQRLEFAQLKWDNGDPATAHFVCKHCGARFHHQDYPEMDRAGRWQTLDGYYYRDDTDLFYDPDDQVIERPKRIGAHIWAAYSYFTTWVDTATKWIEAAAAAKTGNKQKLKTVINTRLGESYEERGESVDAKGFTDLLEDYHFETGIPNEVLVITIGVDVQGGKNPRIELEILGHGLEDETWSIDYVVIPGDPEQPAVWDHLDDQFNRRFTRLDGVELGVAGGFVDSGYLSTEVYKFTGPRRRRNIYATKGDNIGQICNKGTWKGEKKHRAILHTVNVDEAKGIIYYRLKKITEPGPGYCHFPAHYDQDYFDMLTAEEKIEKHKAGRLVGYEWRKRRDRNEALDCRAYNLGALARLNPNLSKIKLRLDCQAAAIAAQKVVEEKPEVLPTVKEPVVARKARVKKKRRGGFVRNY